MADPSVSLPLLQDGAATTKLYKFLLDSNSWDVESDNVTYNFYNINEDAATEPTKWYLEAAQLDTPVTDQFTCEVNQRRCTIAAADGGVYAFKFPSAAACQAFVNQYNDKLFENTYGVPNDEQQRGKVRV